MRDDLSDFKGVRLEHDREILELRSINSSQEVLQILIDTTKLELGKNREDGACERGRRRLSKGL